MSFRFTIRDVLWLTVVVGTALAGVMCSNRLLYLTKTLSHKCEEQHERIWQLESQVRSLKASNT